MPQKRAQPKIRREKNNFRFISVAKKKKKKIRGFGW